MKVFGALFAVLSVAAIPIAAGANVMTFTDLPPGETYGLGSYTEDGITASGTDFYNFPDGTLHLDVGGVPTDNTAYSFALADGPFDLKSFDVVSLGVPETAVGVLRAYDASNQLIRSTDFSIATSQTLIFTDWRKISRLLIFATGDIDDHFSLDNLTLAAAVPEPASWGLLIVGFGMIGTAARRRRSSVVAA